MGVWSRLGSIVGSGVGAIGTAIDRVATLFAGDPEIRRQAAFSVAMVALAAKMAKADGVVTGDEVAAFRRMFQVPQGEERNVARLFNLARQDVAGYRSYAARIARLFDRGDPILEDIIDGLFGIAKADGYIHEAELDYLEDVGAILGLVDEDFERIRLRHVVPVEGDPYLVFGAGRDLDVDALKRHYRRLVAESHPDRLIARGVPPEFIAIANTRMAAINVAWAAISRERGIR